MSVSDGEGGARVRAWRPLKPTGVGVARGVDEGRDTEGGRGVARSESAGEGTRRGGEEG